MVGKQLITGRNLHSMAIRGARAYKKALAFSTHKWDKVKMKPKESGDNLDDVIEYVRRMMYRDKIKEKSKRSESSDDESEDDDNEANDTRPPSPSTVQSPPSPSSLDILDTSENVAASKDDSEVDSIANSDSDKYDSDIPSDYLFPSFYVFVLYGPFVPTSHQLDINVIDNNQKKKGEGTRAALRKKEAKEKSDEKQNDSESTRGFTTDQRIDIKTLSLQKESMLDRKHEVAMVALSLEESSMTKLVEAAERRALQRCPKYSNTNVYWKKVDGMLIEQEQLMAKIKNFNNSIMDQKPLSVVSEFLNEPSPLKKTEGSGH